MSSSEDGGMRASGQLYTSSVRVWCSGCMSVDRCEWQSARHQLPSCPLPQPATCWALSVELLSTAASSIRCVARPARPCHILTSPGIACHTVIRAADPTCQRYGRQGTTAR